MTSSNGTADAGVFAVNPPARELLTAARAEELVLAPAQAAVAAAAASGTPIHTARLGGLSFGADAAPVGAAALAALTAAGTLTTVDVADTIAARPEAEALAALAVLVAPLAGLESLRSLDVSDNALGAKGIRSLRAALSGTAGRLTNVAFQNNGLAADAGALITDFLTLPDGGEEGSAAATATTKAGEEPSTGGRVSALTELRVHNNLLEDAGMVSLAPLIAASPRLATLRLSSLRVGARGMACVADALAGAVAAGGGGVAGGPGHSRLRVLDLSDNTVGAAGAAALAEGVLAVAPRLGVLNLRDTSLGDLGARRVLAALTAAQELRKEVSTDADGEDGDGDKGAAVPGVAGLTQLDLSGNELSPEGARWVAKFLRAAGATLTTLLLDDNELTSAGALKVARALTPDTTPVLASVSMTGNGVGGRGAVALATAAAALPAVAAVGLNENAIAEQSLARVRELLSEDVLGDMSDNEEDEDEDEEEEEGEDEGDEDAGDEGTDEEVDALTERLARRVGLGTFDR